jgi:hypothetical protein
MRRCILAVWVALVGLSIGCAQQSEKANLGESKSFEGPHGLKITVRVMVPQEQECDLLYLCFFKHKEKDTVVETIQKFDDKLGGLIASLRNRGEFKGDALETILINPPAGSLKANKFMIIGWGDEAKLSHETMQGVGAVALREAARLRAKRIAFGAALRDQKNDKFDTGDVAEHVLQSALLAYDTEKRLEKEGLGAGLALEEFVYLAGPDFYHKVVPLAQKGVEAANAAIKLRPTEPLSKKQ